MAVFLVRKKGKTGIMVKVRGEGERGRKSGKGINLLSLSPGPGVVQPLESAAFVFQQPQFALHTVGVAAGPAVSGAEAVAGHKQGHRIASCSAPYSPGGHGPA